MLCEQCKYVLTPKYNLGGPSIKYNRKIIELKAGSASCQLCLILSEWIPKSDSIFGTPRTRVSPENATMRYLLQVRHARVF
jgi:hypothetical protein